jgi:hypothetical protein
LAPAPLELPLLELLVELPLLEVEPLLEAPLLELLGGAKLD